MGRQPHKLHACRSSLAAIAGDLQVLQSKVALEAPGLSKKDSARQDQLLHSQIRPSGSAAVVKPAARLCESPRVVRTGSSRRPVGSAPVGTGAGLSLGCEHLCSCRTQWTHGSAEMGAAAWLSLLGHEHVQCCSQRGPPCSAAVCPPERLCLGPKHMQGCSCSGPPCSAAVCSSERLCLGSKHVRDCSQKRPPGSAAVCPPEGLPMELKHVRGCSQRWPPGSPGVCPPEWLSLGASCLHGSRCTWQPQHSAVAAPTWLPVGQQHVSHGSLHNHLELLRWARQQQPPCPLWSRSKRQSWIYQLFQDTPLRPCMLVYLLQQRAHLPARKRAQARVAATEMTHAVLSLRAALPDKTPHEIVLSIVSLAFS